MLRPAARLGENRQDVGERLPELSGECFVDDAALSIAADLAGDDHLPAGHVNAVRKTLGPCPAGRLQDAHHGAHLPSILSLKRCSLPVSVRGSAATNSTSRGYL